jgi:hypothetical protein
MPSCYLEIYAGEQSKFEEEDAQYQLTRSLLDKHASTFGLPSLPEDLDAEQQDILGDVHVCLNRNCVCESNIDLMRQKSDSQPLRFRAPIPLLVGRLVFQLDDAPGLAKTRQNFIALCTGEKGQCKSSPKKKLHYMDCPIHRIVRSFVAQGGDVTRGDGSGGEVCMLQVGNSTFTFVSVDIWAEVGLRESRIASHTSKGKYRNGQLGRQEPC